MNGSKNGRVLCLVVVVAVVVVVVVVVEVVVVVVVFFRSLFTFESSGIFLVVHIG